MIRLSYSSLNNLQNGHEWINKQLGIPVPDYPFLTEGKEAHRTIQDHISGKVKNPLLKDITMTFPVVETKDFDERCKFSFKVETTKNEYEIFGFVDGYDPGAKRLLEIKTSTNGWSITEFRDSMQRKLYSLAYPEYKEFILITGSKNPEKWKSNPPKLFSLTISDKDRQDARGWYMKGIEILESGNFTGGLDENGKCKGCFWNMDRYPELANCHFR